MTRPHRGHPLPSHAAAAGGAVHHAWDDRLRTFRHRAGAFALLDHEATPAAIVSLTLGAGLLVALAVQEGRAVHPDAARPTALAWFALVCLVTAIVAGAAELSASVLARPVGRDLARAAAGLEGARSRVLRLDRIAPPEDADLATAAIRVDHAIDHLSGRVDDALAALAAFAGLPDRETRVARFQLLREESRRIVAAADAIDGALHLLLWIDACPWSSARADALGRLRADLAAAERLVTDSVAA